MLSTDPRRRQSGQSLVEVLVASGLLGLGIVGGLAALDAASMAARQATQRAWAACVVRAESEAVLRAAWLDSGAYAAPGGTVVVAAGPYPGVAGLQQVSVAAVDPGGRPVYQVTVLKSRVLSGAGAVDTAAVTSGCPAR